MARTTIYINDELKERMDAVTEPVNWSDIARRAFEIELGEIAKRKRERDMSAVIDRLRASKLESDSTDYQEGHEAGRNWAEREAEYSELKRLNNRERERSYQDWDWDYRSIPKCTGGDNYEAEEFWEVNIFESDVKDKEEDFFNGFVAGAIEVLEQVEDKL